MLIFVITFPKSCREHSTHSPAMSALDSSFRNKYINTGYFF